MYDDPGSLTAKLPCLGKPTANTPIMHLRVCSDSVHVSTTDLIYAISYHSKKRRIAADGCRRIVACSDFCTARRRSCFEEFPMSKSAQIALRAVILSEVCLRFRLWRFCLRKISTPFCVLRAQKGAQNDTFRCRADAVEWISRGKF